MITCSQVVDLLIDYIEGDLPAATESDLERHFEDCPECLQFLREYRGTSELCRRELSQNVPEELEERLLDYLRERLRPHTSTG